jgi:hypothetical protein
MKGSVAAVMTVGMLLGAGPARAGYVGERAATDALLTQEVQLAVAFWADRGVVGCGQGIAMSWADSLAGPDVLWVAGRGGDCHIWLNVTHVRRSLRIPPARHRRMHGELVVVGAADGDRRDGAIAECRIVVHEVGHALGLQHTPTGVMSAAPDMDGTPWACRKFVRARLTPRGRR